MNFKITAFLFLTIAVLSTAAGCKKSDNPEKFPDLNGVYHESNTEELSAPVMYTVNGKVTNQDTISAYFARHKNYLVNIFVLNQSTLTEDNSAYEENFKGDGTVVLSNSNKAASATYTITDKSSTGFLLEATDTSRIFEEPTFVNTTRSNIINAYVNAINRITNCKPVPPGVGYNEECTFRDSEQFIIKNGQVYLALISYSTTSSSEIYGSSYSAIGNDSGYFNTGVISQLMKGDTVVYQNKLILLNKI